MVIVLVIDSMSCTNNGTSISSKRFAEALRQHGHTVRVVTLGELSASGPDPETGLEMFYVPELIVPIVSALAHKQKDVWARPVRQTLEQAFAGADVVHVFNPWPLEKKAARVARRMGIPVLGAFHCQPENITYNIGLSRFPLAAHLVYDLLDLFYYRKFNHIHCPSRFIADQLRRHGYRQRLHIISNGVHPDFGPAAPKEPLLNKPFRILMVGRLSPEKRQDVLIRAVELSSHRADIQLIFAGKGPCEQKLRQMGQTLSHPPVFCFLSMGELIRLMQSCDLYVHSSDVEIEGIACLEAFTCGLVPVISDSRMSATAQFALAPENLFKSGSPTALAERMDYWLENPARLQQASQEYMRFSRKYTLEHSITSIESVYASLIHQQDLHRPGGWLFNTCSRLFYTAFAVPVLYIWMRAVLGARIRGAGNYRRLRGALTVCNHVHGLDSVLVALSLFPRQAVFTSLPANMNSLWPGAVIRLLGGVAVTGKPHELKSFMDEMKYLLARGRVVHFFPEGELEPYNRRLRDFKTGAFYLAARAQVPIVPLSI